MPVSTGDAKRELPQNEARASIRSVPLETRHLKIPRDTEGWRNHDFLDLDLHGAAFEFGARITRKDQGGKTAGRFGFGFACGALPVADVFLNAAARAPNIGQRLGGAAFDGFLLQLGEGGLKVNPKVVNAVTRSFPVAKRVCIGLESFHFFADVV